MLILCKVILLLNKWRYKNTWKKSLLNNLGLLFSARKNVLNSFKSKLFPIKNSNETLAREPAPDKVAEPATEPTPKVAT